MIMDIMQLASELANQKTTALLIQQLQHCTSSTITPPEKKQPEELVKSLGQYIHNNRHKESIALFLVLMLWDPVQTLIHVRKQGTFRASKTNFSSGAINKTITAALSQANFLKLGSDGQGYLRSIQNLLLLADPCRKLKESLVQRLSTQKSTVLKTLLVIVNEYLYESETGEQFDVGDNVEISAEEIAESYSYILFLMKSIFVHVEHKFIYTDASCWDRLDSNYLPLLRDAAKLRRYIEVEIQVDGMPYEVERAGDVIQVFSTEEVLEKSIRIGYIQAELQQRIKVEQIAKDYPEESAKHSVQTIVNRALQHGLGELVQLKRTPLERYIFNMPLDEKFFVFLADDALFKDEYISVMGAGIEKFAQSDIQLEMVTEGITVFDVIKVQRLFSFVYHAMKNKIEESHGSEERVKNKLFVNSIVPVFTYDALTTLLKMIMTEENAEKLIKLLTLDEARTLIDIQYYPFIKTGNYYAIAPSLVFKSNLLRNIVVGNSPHKRLTGISDPMQASVISALEQSGFLVASEMKSNKQGAIENDITCWRDGELFVFECKNAYHPCSTKELSNSYEHIKKAGYQLDVRKQWLEDSKNQAAFFGKCGWHVPFVTAVHTAVITANRLFHGYRAGAHPVRQAHELINVLVNGFIKRSDDKKLRFWEKDAFQVNDLLNYLQDKSIIAMQMEQLEPYESDVRMGAFSLRRRGYRLDLVKAAEQAELHFPHEK